LIAKSQRPYDEIFQFVQNKRPCILPNLGFIKQLKEYEKKIIINFHDEISQSISNSKEKILNHSFVLELANGTLSQSKFYYYLIQYYLFLIEFNNLTSILVSNMTNENFNENNLKELYYQKNLYYNMISENELEESIAKEEISPNSLLYTSHFYRIVSSSPYVESLAILYTHCYMQLEISKILINDKTNGYISEAWKNYFSENGFKSIVSNLGNLLDHVTLQLQSNQKK